MDNKEEIIQAINNLNEIELAILRERILTITEFVINNKDTFKGQLDEGFISGDMYVDACQHIFDEFNFKEGK